MRVLFFNGNPDAYRKKKRKVKRKEDGKENGDRKVGKSDNTMLRSTKTFVLWTYSHSFRYGIVVAV